MSQGSEPRESAQTSEEPEPATTPESGDPTSASGEGGGEKEHEPSWKFLRMFRSYGTAMGLIVVATPVVTTVTKWVPLYAHQAKRLTFFGTFAAVLCVTVLFSIRHRIGSSVFPSSGRFLLPDSNISVINLETLIIDARAQLQAGEEPERISAEVRGSVGKPAELDNNGHKGNGDGEPS